MVTPSESFPTKSRNYLYAESVFHVQFNDVDFYVEDADKQSLYYSILSRLFPDVQIDRIFPLGGKPAVIHHAQNNRTRRKSVYILDKDFADLLGILVSLPTVVYLDRFCIENYILEPVAIWRFVVAERPTLTEHKVRTSLDIPEFIRTAIRDLRMLFFHFFMVQKHGFTLENCGMPVARFTRDNRQWDIDEAKVRKYQKQVATKAAAVGIDLSMERQRYSIDFEMQRRRLLGRNVSGKYLLTLLLRRICRLFSVRGTSLDSATFRLAEYCELSALRDFRAQVSKRFAIRNQ